MAQEGRGDETTPPLCAMGCGFFGNPATRNFCSKCYNALLLEKLKATPAIRPIADEVPTKDSSSAPATWAVAAVGGGLDQQGTAHRPGRCDGCKKKVGLLGFKCRCGRVFCGGHRHPEQHGCTVDFKAVGREAIARANPLVKVHKLQKL